MLVYGDRERASATEALVEQLLADAAGVPCMPAGIVRHAALVALFIALTGLWQGVADAAFAEAEEDEADATLDSLAILAVAAADAVDRSWSSGLGDQQAPDLFPLRHLAMPEWVTVRECEGYAFYALYPEQILAAARAVPCGAVVIGLRSIGAGLAALVAAASDAAMLTTVRPVGPPFVRTLSIGSALAAAIDRMRDRPFVLVDEGPGLSGSSFGGAADWLEARSVPREAIRFVPSHGGDPGDHASPEHLRRWRGATRHVVAFEDVLLNGPIPLAEWFRDVTGRLLAPPCDVSGGRWRSRSPWPEAPADPVREVRKYRIEAQRGVFLLRFAGLGGAGPAKFARAQSLHAAGFVPEPLAHRHGFLLERWVDATAPKRDQVVATLPRYLAFRAATFTDASAGASLPALLAMARQNLGEGLGSDATPLLDPWSKERLAALSRHVRPLQVDGRLHRWEWLQTPTGIMKADAIDHSDGHDLIGCQDIAWDVAGAGVEFSLSGDELAALTAAVMLDRPEAAELVAFCTTAYCAFQLGWWSFAPPDEGAREVARYRDAARALMAA